MGGGTCHVYSARGRRGLPYQLFRTAQLLCIKVSAPPNGGVYKMPHRSRRMTQRRYSYDEALALMREFNSGTISCSAMAEREGVDRKTLWNLLNGITYRDIWVTAQRELENGPGYGWETPREAATSNKPTSLKLKQILAALQSRPGQWALVKRTKKKPQVAYWHSKGLETACRRMDDGDWGVYARWPDTEPVPYAE